MKRVNGVAFEAIEDHQPLVVLTVPHSGTHYMKNALADLNLPYGTRWEDASENGIIGHFYTLGESLPQTALLDNDVPILTPLRDPMAIALSTWRSAVESRVETEQAWENLRENLLRSWYYQQKYWERLHPVPIEWIVQAPADSFAFRHLLPGWSDPQTQFYPKADRKSREYDYKGMQSGDWIKRHLPHVWKLMLEDFYYYSTPYQAHYPFWWVREV
jgi:hypothetical protein